MRFVVVALLSATPVPPAVQDVENLASVWTCPVHREITEDAEGSCHLCQRELIPVLVQEAWSCTLHAVVSAPEAGSCPICGRTLYPITVEVSFVCPMHPDVKEPHPGSCPLCSMALQPSTSTRPHQDHNPKHGGLFFMAPDAWHHLEGVYPEEGVFRVYLYDNFSRPLDARPFRGRAVLEEAFDPATRETIDLVAFPLRPSSAGEYLEAEVGAGAWPREITAKIQFEPDGELDRFDFIFADYSRESDVADPAPTTELEVTIPDTPAAISVEIDERRRRVRELIEAGRFDQVYVPALQAKELALALDAAPGSLSESDRRSLRWALKQLVRSAWMLDDFGDLGDRQKVQQAFELFREAVESVAAVYGAGP